MTLASTMFEGNATSKFGSAQASNYADAYGADLGAMNDRLAEISRRSSQQIGERAREGLRAEGRFASVMADSGVVGNSAAALMRELGLDVDSDIAALRQSAASEIDQVGRARRTREIEYRNQTDSIKKPSPVGVGLQLFGSAIKNKDGIRLNELGAAAKK